MENTSLPVEAQINENEEAIKKIEGEITQLKIWVKILIGFSVIAVALGIFWVREEQINWSEKLDRLGSFAGGFSGSLLALASMVFIYQGLLKQQQQLLRQRSDIDLTLAGMRQTQVELEGQKKELAQQNAHWEQQRVEDTYFRLLGNYHNIDLPIRPEFSSFSKEQNFHRIGRKINGAAEEALHKLGADAVKDEIRQLFNSDIALLKIPEQLVFIIEYLLRKGNAEILLDHLSVNITTGEKAILFFYVLRYPQKDTLFTEWYLNSKMIVDAGVGYDLMRLLNPDKFPPQS